MMANGEIKDPSRFRLWNVFYKKYCFNK
jgi:hypothetical protein